MTLITYDYDPLQATVEVVEGYDVMQVCLNGHQITETATSQPQFKKPFCTECGERTITECPECNAPILGHYHSSGAISLVGTPVPKNCHGCGAAYPWRQAAISNAIEVLQMDLDPVDAEAVTSLVSVIAVESPRTEIAALKLKQLMAKLGKATYDIGVKVVSDVASETAKKALGFGSGSGA